MKIRPDVLLLPLCLQLACGGAGPTQTVDGQPPRPADAKLEPVEPLELPSWAQQASIQPAAPKVSLGSFGQMPQLRPEVISAIVHEGALFLVSEGAVEAPGWRVELPSARRVTINGDEVFVLSLDERTDSAWVTVIGLADGEPLRSFEVPSASEVKAIGPGRLALANRSFVYLVGAADGAVEAEIQLSAGLIYGSFGFPQVGDRLFVPRAYPGGIDIIDLTQGELLETVWVQDWIHDVLPFPDGRYVTAGHLGGLSVVGPDQEIVVETGQGFAAHLFPASEDSAFALVGDRVLRIGLDAEIRGEVELPEELQNPDAFTGGRFDDWIVDRRGDQLLVLIHDKGLGLVTAP